MGAEHKLDLTSDVTHLLVGDTDTPKYKYVAKERQDVKILRPEWIDAVRNCWMNAAAIDLDALLVEYRLPILFGLKICITGFDDLSFRAQLQKNVIENGGEYTGDLTKDVTHLIAAKPEGKKFEYGTQWQKKVVSLAWYKDTLTRGMQLDETLYHPSTPINEQGIGAWRRSAPPQPQLGKRTREDNTGPEPPRKLRRTASARLGSQSDNLWTDIVTGGGFEGSEQEQPSLRPTKFLPGLRPRSETLHIQPEDQASERPATVSIDSGYLDGKQFVIDGFDQRKHDKLQQILLAHGGTVLASLKDLVDAAPFEEATNIMIVPHGTPTERVKANTELIKSLSIVSELWLEWCMFTKSFVSPQSYPLSSLLPRVKPPGFSKMRVNVTGFPGIQTLHISKVLKLMGAQYEETFTASTSVLVCKRGSDNLQKLDYARVWQVPVVSEAWLGACIRESRMVSFEKHLLQAKNTNKVQKRADAEKMGGQKKPNEQSQSAVRCVHQTKPARDDGRPGSDFLVHEDWTRLGSKKAQPSPPNDQGNTRSELATADPALREISPNSPTRKAIAPESKPKKRLFKTLDGPSSSPPWKPDDENIEVHSNAPVEDTHIQAEPKNQDIAGDIREFYNMRANSMTNNNRAVDKSPRKARLQGRALSNLSYTSATSKTRQSRASSVDSINTDGIGSEIAPVTSGTGKSQDAPEVRGFTGRARSRLLEEIGPSVEFWDPGLYTEAVAVEEQAPQMTQLLYDDSEDTIALREKLAAKRRQRSRLGQKQTDPKPGEPKEPKRIRDDDIIANSGWGAGRRTRNKDRTS